MEATIAKQEKAIEQLSHYQKRKQQIKQKLHSSASSSSSKIGASQGGTQSLNQPETSTSPVDVSTNTAVMPTQEESYFLLLYYQLLQSYYHLKIHRKGMVLMTIR